MNSDAHTFPLFPLPVVLFPGNVVPLHIFEPRYRAMIGDCLSVDDGEDSKPFVICLEHEQVMHEHGTTARVIQVVNTFDDGRFDILVQGRERVVVEDSFPGDDYVLARTTPFSDLDQRVDPELAAEVTELCRTYLGLIHSPAAMPELQPGVHPSFALAGGSIDDVLVRQNLLKLRRESERLDYLRAFFSKAIPGLRRIEEVTNRVKTNGHFKSIP